jgi:hypothetical protein
MKFLKMSLDLLTKIKLAPVINGAISGSMIEAGSLWSQNPVAIYVVRRPG